MNYPSDQPPYYSYDQYNQGYQQRPYQTLGGQPNGHLSNMRPQGGSSGIYPHNETMDDYTTGSQGPQKLSNGTNTLSIYSTPAGNNRRGFWSPEEDRRLMELISIFGASNWVKISNSLSTRTPKQCRERYHQNLKPSLNRKPISTEEGELIEQLVAKHGKKWAEIARHLNGRSDNAVKNWWNGGANRKRRATVHMKTSPEQLFSTTAGHSQDLIQDQRNVQSLPQPLPQPHPPQQISFKTSMFGNQEVANNTPPLSSTSSANSTSPYRTSNQRLASLDVDNVSQLMHHHNMHGSSSQSANTNVSNLNSNQNIVLPPLNNVNGSLPSLILPSKKRLLDDHNPISRRHSYANTMYSVQNQNAHANNITNSNPNLSNLVNASHQPSSLNTSGQSSPYHGSPLMLSNQASRNNSISIPNFEFSTLNTSNATSLSDSRRSSYNPDFFPNPLKDNPQTSHKRNISQNSFNSPLTPSYRYSVSSGGSAYNTTTNTNSNSNSNANTNINTGNTTINSAIDADQQNASPKNFKADKAIATGSEDKRRAGQDKNHFGSDRIDGDQDMKENTEATENTKISVSSLLD